MMQHWSFEDAYHCSKAQKHELAFNRIKAQSKEPHKWVDTP
jgi:hypothetical protein